MGALGKKEKRITDSDRSSVCDMRSKGESLEAIVKATGISLSTVRWILAKSGVKLSREAHNQNLKKAHPRQFPEALDSVILDLVSRGVNQKSIAEQLKVPKSFVELTVKRNGAHALSSARGKNIWKSRWSNTLSMSGASSPSELMRVWAVGRDGDCVGAYVDAHTPIEWKCSKGHIFMMSPNKVQQDQWCPSCSHSGPSSGELEVFEYVKSVLPADSVLLSDRTAIKPFELDIYVPSNKLAIEYNGLLYHSSYFESKERPYGPHRHNKKALACRAAKISLLAIFEDEWANKQDLIKAMIRWRLGVFSGTKLNARDLELRRLDKNGQFNTFFDRNHIDGHVRANWAYGLFWEDKLVMCTSVRTNFVGETELARMATDYDYSVRGGASRLVAAVLGCIEGDLISYSNNRLSTGDVYQKLGFDKLQDNGPSYWYTDGKGARIQRFNCKRNNDPAILAKFPTEKDQARGGVFSQKYFGDDRPLYQIHDYGHIKWIFRKPVPPVL